MITICKLVTDYYHVSYPTIVRAVLHESNTDVTFGVRMFYCIDSIISVASLQRWLTKLGYDDDHINIIQQKDHASICASRVDLNNDRELLTNSDIIGGDISLQKLPAMEMYRCGDSVVDATGLNYHNEDTTSCDHTGYKYDDYVCAHPIDQEIIKNHAQFIRGRLSVRLDTDEIFLNNSDDIAGENNNK